MSERGVFAVDRGVFDHPIFKSKEPFSRREAWLWLLSEAEWKPSKRVISGKMVELNRGQLAHSVRFMAEAWGWSKSAVDRFLGRLKTETMIGTESGTGCLVITICKYSDYQKVSLPKRDNIEPLSGTAAGQQRDRLESSESNEGISSLRSDITPAAKSPASKDLSEFKSALSEIGPERVEAMVMVRKAKKAPLNAYSAKLFIKAAANCNLTVSEAADLAIERNWLTVKPDWVANARGSPVKTKQTMSSVLTNLISEMETANDIRPSQSSLGFEPSVLNLPTPSRQRDP